MKIEISEDVYKIIKEWKEGHGGYKDYDLDKVFESFLNLGWYAYNRDGFDGSAHIKPDGDFGING